MKACSYKFCLLERESEFKPSSLEEWDLMSPINSALEGVDRNIWMGMTFFYSQGRPAYWPISLSTSEWIPDFNRKAFLCKLSDPRGFQYLKNAQRALIMLLLLKKKKKKSFSFFFFFCSAWVMFTTLSSSLLICSSLSSNLPLNPSDFLFQLLNFSTLAHSSLYF